MATTIVDPSSAVNPGGTSFAQDPAFLSASPADQINYLSSFDKDFASASPQDQIGYLNHLHSLSPAGQVNRAIASVPKPPNPILSAEPQIGLTSGPDLLGNRARALENEAQRQNNLAYGPESEGKSLLSRLGHGTLSYVPATAAFVDKTLSGLLDPKTDLAIASGAVDPAIPAAYFGTQGIKSLVGIGTPSVVSAAIKSPSPDNVQNALGSAAMVAGSATGAAGAGGESPVPSVVRSALGPVNDARAALARKIVDPMVYENVGETAADTRMGTDPARGLVDEGLVGGSKSSLLDKANARLAQLKSAADNILQNHPNSRTIIDAEPLIDGAIDNAVSNAQKLGAGDTVTRLENLREALKTQYGPLQGTPYDINQLKTNIQNSANELGAYRNTVPAEASAAQAAKDAATSIKNALNARVPEAAELNQRMSDLIDAGYGLQKKINLARGEDLFGGGALSNKTGVLGRLGQRTIGSAPVRSAAARVLNAGNVKSIPAPTAYIPPAISGLLKAAPVELGSSMEPIGAPSKPSPTLDYQPSFQQPPAFVAPSQIRPSGASPSLLFPNKTSEFSAGSFPDQGNLFQIGVPSESSPSSAPTIPGVVQRALESGRIGDPAAVARDNALFQQAKGELPKGASASEVAQRAQQLRDQATKAKPITDYTPEEMKAILLDNIAKAKAIDPTFDASRLGKNPFDVTEGAMDALERDPMMPRRRAQ